MNQHSEEIHTKLRDLAQQYNFTIGILLVEEADENTSEKNYRVITFDTKAETKKPVNLHKFSNLFHSCVEMSKTFSAIIEHGASHILENMFVSIGMDVEDLEGKIKEQRLKRGGKDVN